MTSNTRRIFSAEFKLEAAQLVLDKTIWLLNQQNDERE